MRLLLLLAGEKSCFYSSIASVYSFLSQSAACIQRQLIFKKMR